MFHVGVLLHLNGVLEVLLKRGQNELMIQLAVVAKLKADLLAAADLDPVGDEVILPSFSLITTWTGRAGFLGSPGLP